MQTLNQKLDYLVVAGGGGGGKCNGGGGGAGGLENQYHLAFQDCWTASPLVWCTIINSNSYSLSNNCWRWRSMECILLNNYGGTEEIQFFQQ